MLLEILSKIKSFVQACDKLTLCFSLVVLNQLFGFTPSFPSIILYSSYIVYAVYVLLCRVDFLHKGMALFLLYIPVELLITAPNAVFRSWERYVFFGLLIVCVSPLLSSERLYTARLNMFRIVLFLSVIIGVGSFIARFVGINYMFQGDIDKYAGVGLFGGITPHSMLLGPVAGIGAIYMSYCGYECRKWIYWACAACCLFAVMFSASRAALMSSLAGIVVTLYKQSGATSRFIRMGVVLGLIFMVSYPVWGGALDAVKQKNEGNKKAGSVISSRENLWDARIAEFQSSPVLGVGFTAVDDAVKGGTMPYDVNTGMVESGSSWLIILSMTGLIGSIFLLPLFVSSFFLVWRDPCSFSALISGVLVLFYVHMIAEGYIFYAGSTLTFIMWLTVGVAHDCKYVWRE